MESLLDLMKSRQGIRKFSNQNISGEILKKIIEAGISAPSSLFGGNHLMVIADSELKQKLRKECELHEKLWMESQPAALQERIKKSNDYPICMDYISDAPVLLAVTTRPRDPEIPYAVESAFLAVGYLLVMIEGLGLGSLTYTPSAPSEGDIQGINNLLGLPEGEAVQAILPLGYPAEKPSIKKDSSFYNVFLNTFNKPLRFDELKNIEGIDL